MSKRKRKNNVVVGGVGNLDLVIYTDDEGKALRQTQNLKHLIQNPDIKLKVTFKKLGLVKDTTKSTV